jgi:hypothetical protein
MSELFHSRLVCLFEFLRVRAFNIVATNGFWGSAYLSENQTWPNLSYIQFANLAKTCTIWMQPCNLFSCHYICINKLLIVVLKSATKMKKCWKWRLLPHLACFVNSQNNTIYILTLIMNLVCVLKRLISSFTLHVMCYFKVTLCSYFNSQVELNWLYISKYWPLKWWFTNSSYLKMFLINIKICLKYNKTVPLFFYEINVTGKF